MASSSTALSKTAINTLRGVLFTTSLSVVLLAEERRRRIKIARAAVDNARKIHAAKANRGAEAAAAIEPFDLEAHLARLDGESFIRQPRAQRSLHRRTKGNEAEISSASSLAVAPTESHPTALAAPLRNIHDDSIPLTHIAEVMANTRGLGELPTIRRAVLSRKSRRKTDPVEKIAKLAAAGQMTNEASTPARTVTISNLSAETSAALPSHRLEYEHLIVTPRDSKEASIEYNDAVAALIEAARALPENLDNSEEQSSAFKTAVTALQGVSTHDGTRRSFREILKDVVVNLLKYSVDLTADEMRAVLKASLFLKRSIVTILTRFLAWMDKHRPEDATEVAGNIIAFFTQPEQASLWKDGLLVQELIKVQSADSAELAIREYTMLKSAGLFAKMRTPEQEYDIRREAVIAACSTGQTRFIDAEMIFLRKLKGNDVETDFELQAALMTQQVALGVCDTVFDSLRNLEKYKKSSSTEFQAHLRRFTDLFAKAHDADELCQWLEYTAESYSMTVRTEWAFAVLNGYACYHDIKGMISWLEFCLAHGLKVDYHFAMEWKKTCRGHLRFSKDNTQILWERMERAILLPQMGGNGYQAKQRKDDLSKRMAELNNAGLWEKACLVFEAALSKSRDTCESSLELALEAHVQANEGNAEPALRLLERARGYGRDTKIPQHHFLAKEIKSKPIRDIKAFLLLAVECESDIPADIYTLAVKRVVEKDLYAAHDILQLGVKQLGHGKLAYNGYCFAKLLYIHIATHRYDAALRLVSEFVSDKPFWHGTRLCKESIKFGIRELTKRAAARMDAGNTPGSEGSTLNCELRLTELLQQALEQNAESRHEVGYQTMISDMIVRAVEEATREKDAAAALEWQRKKLAKRATRRTSSNPRAVTLRQGSIAHISIDA
ncbi:hypothetical protein ISF_05808 [Cordyceps fumosorosea ARSEF 2679]|uniref:Uncharacterized protein n=1 Tax=Cordyceps fumosorosea (strain ARSEF 2679) TaxID=1081104 RepID=A0A167TN52_CORFA|nr:hypothetical protein ISF_05808 [Cordyceps fumosorosea ARSEF 2679]OAA60769.1 hypothetical protein ISF_05808 [Cordyceps fumosorosea ARSEF 2679]